MKVLCYYESLVLLLSLYLVNTQAEFNIGLKRITERESLAEYLTIPTKPKQLKIWKRLSRQYFRKAGCMKDTTKCVNPFVICDFTPEKSSFERKKIIWQQVILKNTTSESTSKNMVTIEEFPYFVDEEETCFIVSLTPKIARNIAKQSCNIDEKPCIIHPLLPMMKLSQWTIHKLDEPASASDDVLFSVMAALSPYYKRTRDEIYLQSIIESLVDRSQSESNCLTQLQSTFPHVITTSFSCLNAHYLNASQIIEIEWINDEIVSFHVKSESDDPTAVFREKLLRFLFGLAGRPEFSSVDVTSFEDYYYL